MGVNGISCVVLHLGHYLYTKDLVKLDSCRPQAGKLSVEKRLSRVFTPLNLSQWESMLEHHPHRVYVDFILSGIKDGFRVGYNRPSESELALFSARKNMKSVDNNPHVVKDYLDAELRRDRHKGCLLDCPSAPT